jgi:hypothetical protein
MAALEIVGAAEAADILDIGNTNFSHLRKQRADTDDAFPDPMVVLKCGPIWKKSDVNKYAKTFTKGRRGPKPSDATAPPKAVAKKAVVKKVVAKKKLSLAKS